MKFDNDQITLDSTISCFQFGEMFNFLGNIYMIFATALVKAFCYLSTKTGYTVVQSLRTENDITLSTVAN